jgi:nucleoside-diphosphate-sugar epimerase
MSVELRGRKIAIIGGAGFIGHALALDLQRQGANVEIVDSLQVNNLLWFASGTNDPVNRDLNLRMINQRLELLRSGGIIVHPQDARDYHALSRILDQVKPQVIIHLAAVSHAGRSNKDPFSTFDHSLRTLENALDCARSSAVEHFIFLSSSMAYGNFMTPSVDEDHPLNPIGIYGALKLAGEKMVIAYQQVFGLPYTILRPSALYGPRCVSRRVIQIFIEAALRDQPLRIDGDGEERLDFTYIDDLVHGLTQAVVREESRNEIFNITYGNARSIRECVELLRGHFPDLKVQSVERDQLMPFRGTLKIDKAVRLLQYAPTHPLEVGLPKYVNWYRSLMSEQSVPSGV